MNSLASCAAIDSPPSRLEVILVGRIRFCVLIELGREPVRVDDAPSEECLSAKREKILQRILHVDIFREAGNCKRKAEDALVILKLLQRVFKTELLIVVRNLVERFK